MKNKDRLIPFLSTFAGAFFFYLLFTVTGTMENWNRKISDVIVSIFPMHHSFSKNVVIIDIDEQSLAFYADHPELGQWPWKRSIYPNMFAYANMGGAELILMDILFTERSDRDSALVQANQAFPNVSHAVALRRDPLAKEKKLPSSISNFTLDLDSNLPFPSFEDGAFPAGGISDSANFLHVVTIIPDHDGVLRRFAPVLRLRNYSFPALALRGSFGTDKIQIKSDESKVTLNKKDNRIQIPIGNDGLIRSYFYSEETLKNIPRFSASGVLESFSRIQEGLVEDEKDLLVPLSVFENKVVIIGTSAPATHDDVVTPFGMVPGVIAQAVFVSNLLEGHSLTEIPTIWNDLLFLSLLGGSLFWLFFSTEDGSRILNALIFLIGTILIAFVSYRLDFVVGLGPLVSLFPLSYMVGFSYLSYVEGKEKRKYNSVLRNLVDSSVVKGALEDIETLRKGGEWEITAFFSDVAGFSGISEELSPTDLAQLLNEYLSAMTLDLKENGGTLDKYIGDAVVGIFGAPLKNDRHVLDACAASLKMRATLLSLNDKWKVENSYTEKARNMKFRIGLNCGIAKVGFMGTDSLASYTMMGDMVNLASRLEAAAKDYGTDILVSQNIQKKAKEKFHFRFCDQIRVKGKLEPVNIYSLEGNLEDINETDLQWQKLYDQAFSDYQAQKFDSALTILEGILKFRKDLPSEILKERCIYLQANTPGNDWDGVFTRSTK